MNWQDFIHSDPTVLLGKPIIKGTRLSVDFILGLLAKGWTTNTILENYPTLKPDALLAIFAYAAETVQEEVYFNMPTGVCVK